MSEARVVTVETYFVACDACYEWLQPFLDDRTFYSSNELHDERRARFDGLEVDMPEDMAQEIVAAHNARWHAK